MTTARAVMARPATTDDTAHTVCGVPSLLNAQVAELITAERCVVLVVEQVDSDTVTSGGSTLKSDEIKDINRSRSYLKDLATRHGVPVFDTVEDCIAHTITLVRRRRTA